MRCAAGALWVVPLFLFRCSLSLLYFVGTLATGVRAVSLCFIFIHFVCVRVGDCFRLVRRVRARGGCCCAACVVAVKAGTFRCRVLNNYFYFMFSRMLTPAAYFVAALLFSRSPARIIGSSNIWVFCCTVVGVWTRFGSSFFSCVPLAFPRVIF